MGALTFKVEEHNGWKQVVVQILWSGGYQNQHIEMGPKLNVQPMKVFKHWGKMLPLLKTDSLLHSAEVSSSFF